MAISAKCGCFSRWRITSVRHISEKTHHPTGGPRCGTVTLANSTLWKTKRWISCGLYHLASRWRNSHGLSWPLTNSPPKLGVALSKFWGKSLMNGYGNSEVWSQNIRVEGTKNVLEKHNNETSGNASSGKKNCVRSSSPLRCFTIKPQPQ